MKALVVGALFVFDGNACELLPFCIYLRMWTYIEISGQDRGLKVCSFLYRLYEQWEERAQYRISAGGK